MSFVDEARIFVQGGNGGQGCESFYRDKYMRFPRPDGGDGGHGGDIIFKADGRIRTLLDFKFKQHYKAPSGGHASSKGKTGRRGMDCILRVPCGTILRDKDNGLMIKDLVENGQSIVVARGGRGGWGNQLHKYPKIFEAGERKTIALELKVMADVGLIGFPNAGKSTFITAVSRVRSKVANYPFTTKQPILGIVYVDDADFVVADLPGIIEGAHQGRGLGDRFLRHAERTKMLVHVLDMAGSEGRDPLEDYAKLNHEIEQYGQALLLKDKIVVANKMDLPEAQGHLVRFRQTYDDPIWPISTLNNEGIEPLLQQLHQRVCQENSPEK